jgi:basic membrane lipoprotein Med (substrate-binding protein (PBP1-ABC) superfamily)
LSTRLNILWVAFALACGGRADGSKKTQEPESAFRVALLTPGPISDQSWNAGAYQGLTRIRDSLGASVSHVQTKTPAEFEENFRQYGAQGYRLVFGHGFEYQDAAKRVGPVYPKTNYVVVSATTAVPPNVASIEFAFDEPSYLAGMLAGAMTRTNVIGTIGGTELPPVKQSFEAFANGAHAVNPKVSILSSFVGNWEDVSAGKEQALAQIARHADVIFQNADAAGLGVFQAARERSNVFVIGSNSDQNAVAPNVTLGSVVIDLPHAYLLVGREVQSGTFAPRIISLGMKDEVTTFVMNPVIRARIPAAALAKIDTARVAIIAGTLRVSGTAAASTNAKP